MISGSNGRLQQQLEYTLQKLNCHSWWISKMQSWREDTIEELYALKFCNKLGKNTIESYGRIQTVFRPSCINRASVFEWHKRLKEGREFVMDDERCGRSKEVNTPQLIRQRVRVRVSKLRSKGIQKEVPSEEASTLQIGSEKISQGQYISPQLHPCHRLFDQVGHQDSFSASL